MKTAEIILPYFKQGEDIKYCRKNTSSLQEAILLHAENLREGATQLICIAANITDEVTIEGSDDIITITGPDEIIDFLEENELVTFVDACDCGCCIEDCEPSEVVNLPPTFPVGRITM